MKPTFIKCTNFKNHHFNQLISNIKRKNKMIKKLPPRPSSKKKNRKLKTRNEKRKTKNKNKK
jgi:hypothetical protein